MTANGINPESPTKYIKNSLKEQSKKEPSLYERLGGVFAIAMVINRFSDEVVKSPKVGKESKNPSLYMPHLFEIFIPKKDQLLTLPKLVKDSEFAVQLSSSIWSGLV